MDGEIDMQNSNQQDGRTTFFHRHLSWWWRGGKRLQARVREVPRRVGPPMAAAAESIDLWFDRWFLHIMIGLGLPLFIVGCIYLFPFVLERGAGWIVIAVPVVILMALPVGGIIWGLFWSLPHLIHIAAHLFALTLWTAILLGTLVFMSGTLGLIAIQGVLVLFLVVLWAVEIWRQIRWRIFYTCPMCAHRGEPLHQCPDCDAMYPRVRPNLYGHLYHLCGSCGASIPTVDWLGRSQLDRYCAGTLPDGSPCMHPLQEQGKLPEELVAIVGTQGSGKTCYRLMLVRELLRGANSNPAPISARILSEDDLRDWDAVGPELDVGTEPRPTMTGVPRAMVLQMTRARRDSLLYLYDAAGEEYSTIQAFGQHRQVRHLDGFILLVDPYTLPGLQEELASRSIQSGNTLDAVTETMMKTLQRMGDAGVEAFDLRLAVVLAKADLEPVRVRIGDIAAAHPTSRDVRDALHAWGAEPALRNIVPSVSEVRYFACSALGREPTERRGEPFEQTGLLEPIKWILETNDA
jgi:hypothetical protein